MTAGRREADRLPAVVVHGFSKTFGGVRVLHDASMTVLAREVHGLVGQNGSGKSTLIKILAGYHEPDPGASLVIGGREVTLPIRPNEIRQLGLSFLHQDLGLVETISVLENLAVGRGYGTATGWRIRWRAERRNAHNLLKSFGLDVNPDTPVARLSQAERAVIGIIRALEQLSVAGREGVIILDEPTAQLPAPDVERLFGAIREAVARGASAVFVSHRIDEVKVITDRVSVLRDGHLIGTVVTDETSEPELVRMILGRDLGELYPYVEPQTLRPQTLLSVRGLTSAQVHGLSFDLHPGEVLGLTGLVGMGHDEVPYLLVGAAKAESGTVAVRGKMLDDLNPRAALRSGIALLPADRQRQGSMQAATIRENVTLPTVGNFVRGGRLLHQRERAHVAGLLKQFDVRPPETERVFSSLSGGNQQKALLAKWLQIQPPVLILHEPTHGVDVGARKQVFEFIRASADRETGIIFCSAEYEDLAHLCDRVLVMRGGRVIAELSGDELTEDRIVEHAYRAETRDRSNEEGTTRRQIGLSEEVNKSVS